MAEPGERERRAFVHCIMPGCNAELACPNEVDVWEWSRSEAVTVFKAQHAAHGSPRTVGIEFRYVEKD